MPKTKWHESDLSSNLGVQFLYRRIKTGGIVFSKWESEWVSAWESEWLSKWGSKIYFWDLTICISYKKLIGITFSTNTANLGNWR